MKDSGQPGTNQGCHTNWTVEQNDRAGIASFGSPVALGASLVGCNVIALHGETYADTPYVFEDLGANLCGWGALSPDGKVLSTGSNPPEPIGP